ncbi:MAG: serine/threonine protein kinase [Gammaproteobacteria bacterium]
MPDQTPPNDPRVLRTGTRLRDYIIERVLGKGGFGITYLARHHYLNNMLVAIKEYMPADQVYRDDRSMVHVQSESHRGDFEYGMKRFIQEAKSLHDLSQQKHPALANIVEVRDFFPANGTAYMVMDYVSGDSLEDVIYQLTKTGKKLSEKHLRSIFSQISRAIDFVHSRELLHRDITPSNIILRNRITNDESHDLYHPVLIDFGSAKVAVSRTMASSRMNSKFTLAIYTPSYAPLEQCDGMPQDKRTDIYGLASTMYHLALRKLPVESLKRRGTLDQDMPDPLVPAVILGAKDAYSKDILTAIDHGMALRMNERPDSIEDWLEPLNLEAANSSPNSTRPSEHSNQPGSAGAVSEWLKSTGNKAIAGLGLLAIFVAVFFTMRPPPPTELIQEANSVLSATPFDSTAIDTARALYLKAQLLKKASSDEISRASSGVAICDMIRDYRGDIDDKNLAGAAEQLAAIQQQKTTSGLELAAVDDVIKSYDFETGLDELSALLNSTSLDAGFERESKALVDKMSPGGKGDPRLSIAEDTIQLLLKSSGELNNNQFANALQLVDEAETLATGIEYRNINMEYARGVITDSRSLYVATLNKNAVERLVASSTETDTLSAAAAEFLEILRIDPNHRPAQDGQSVVKQLDKLRETIASGQAYDAAELFGKLGKQAENAGINGNDWLSMLDEFETAGLQRLLRTQHEKLLATPFDENTQKQTQESYNYVIAEQARLALSSPLDVESNAGLAALKILNEARQNLDGHLYNQTINLLDANAATFEALDDGASIRQKALVIAKDRFEVETEKRVADLISVLNSYRLPGSTQAISEQSALVSLITTDDLRPTKVNELVTAIQTLTGQATSQDFDAAYDLWPTLSRNAPALGTDTLFLQENRKWLDETTFAAGQALLDVAFERFAEKPLDSSRRTAISRSLDRADTLATLAGKENSKGESIRNALTHVDEMQEATTKLAFKTARERVTQALTPLASTELESSRLKESMDAIIAGRESNAAAKLQRQINATITNGFRSVSSRPRDQKRLATFTTQVNELLEVRKSSQIEFDWSRLELAKSVATALETARAMVADNDQYLEAVRTLVATSLNVPDTSSWKRVVTQTTTALQKEKDQRIAKLEREAAASLDKGQFEREAWTSAREKYELITKLEQGATTKGASGLGFVNLLEATAAPFATQAAGWLISGGSGFEQKATAFYDVPGAKPISERILSAINGAAKTYLAAASEQVSDVCAAFDINPTTKSLTDIRRELGALQSEARSASNTATVQLIDNVYPVFDAFTAARKQVDEKAYYTAQATLDSIDKLPGYAQLTRSARNRIKAARANVKSSIDTAAGKNAYAKIQSLSRAFDALSTDPKSAQSLVEFNLEIQKVLDIQSDYPDAITAQKIASDTAELQQTNFAVTAQNCNTVNRLEIHSDNLLLGGLELDWIGELKTELCESNT